MSENKKSKLIILKTITPMHVGASEGNDIVDMPIQREASTNIPKVESSSFKGVLKESYSKVTDRKDINILFGTTDAAGEIGFTDLKLLFFPVKSSKDIFSLITCPYVLERFYEDNTLYNTESFEKLYNLLEEIKKPNEDVAWVLDNFEGYIYLEDYRFKTKKVNCGNLFENIHTLKSILSRVVIVSNDVFIDFVSYYTEVVTRNKIDQETGITKDNALFTQEYVPSEAIFYGIILKFYNILEGNGETYNSFIEKLTEVKDLSVLQLGGNNTLGKGIVKIIY